jgi:hypothetical protein
MASTTYDDFVEVNKIAQEHFRHITKMVFGRFRDLTKTYHLGNANKMVTKCHRFAVLGNMVRNAGELPQPFWLGAACGGGSCSAARCAANIASIRNLCTQKVYGRTMTASSFMRKSDRMNYTF